MIAPSTINDGIVGRYYNQTIGEQGAALPVQWAVTSGALPPGLSINPTRQGAFLAFAGILNTAGTYPFQVTATDANGLTAFISFTVHATDQLIRVSPSSVPSGPAGIPYSVSFSASGGTPPYSFVVLDSAGVAISPPELLMSPTGTLSGVPLPSSLSLFTVRATDSTGLTGSWDYQVSFTAGTLSVSPVSLPFGKIRTFYTAGMTASLGTAPYTFSVTSGALPNGLSMNSAGILSGTPVQAGIFQFAVTANDSLGAFGSVNCQLNIVGDTITLGPSVLPDATANQPYMAQITASGGTSPYTFTMPSATLWSSAMNFAPNGTISGTAPSSVVTLSFTIQATDANGSTGSQVFQINVGASGLILLPGTLTSAIVGAFYSVTFATSGGQAPYSFSLATGSILPAGMTLSNGGLFSGTPTSPGTFHFTVRSTRRQQRYRNTGLRAYCAGTKRDDRYDVDSRRPTRDSLHGHAPSQRRSRTLHLDGHAGCAAEWLDSLYRRSAHRHAHGAWQLSIHRYRDGPVGTDGFSDALAHHNLRNAQHQFREPESCAGLERQSNLVHQWQRVPERLRTERFGSRSRPGKPICKDPR